MEAEPDEQPEEGEQPEAPGGQQQGGQAAPSPGGMIQAMRKAQHVISKLPVDLRQSLEAPLDLPPEPFFAELASLCGCGLYLGKRVPRDHALVGRRVFDNLPAAVAFIGQLVQDVKSAAEAAAARDAARTAGLPEPAPPPGMPSWEAVKEAALARMAAMVGELLGVGTPGLPPLPCVLLDVLLGPLLEAASKTKPFGVILLITLRTATQRLPSQDPEQTNVIARAHSKLADALSQQLGVRCVCIEADLGYGHYEYATFPGWLNKAAATLLDLVVLGLEAATLRVRRVEACDTALSHLGFRLGTANIHAAASRLCMPVLAGVSPAAQVMLLRAMHGLRSVQPGQRPFGLPVACPATHLMPTITPQKVLEAQDWAGGVKAFVMGVASITVGATQLCEPGAGEERHRAVFEATVPPLLALQRKWQAESTGGSWRFALPDKPAFSPTALWDLLRCFDAGAFRKMGADLATEAAAAAGPPPGEAAAAPEEGPFLRQELRRLGELALEAAAAGQSSLHIAQRKAETALLLIEKGSMGPAGASHLLQQTAAAFTSPTRRKGGSPGEPLTLRTVLEHAARQMADPAAEVPLQRHEAQELRRQLRAAARDKAQAGWSEERRAADREARVARQREATEEAEAAKAAAAERRVRKAKAAQATAASSLVSFTGAGGNPYSRPLPEMFRPWGINLQINYAGPGVFGTAMGPYHHWM